jgi:methionyl-tRNA formyltransferase
MGTPDFAVASLDLLLKEGFNVVGVVTATDKLGGRGGKQLLQSDVKKYAVEKGLNILQPEKLKSKDFIQQLKNLNADVQFVVAFRMLPESVWNMPPLGTYNLHGSLLPKYRGAAPINWAIINGEKETGVTTFKLKHDIDTGAILLQQSTPIEQYDDFGTVYDKLKIIGAELLVKTALLIEEGNPKFNIQDDTLSSHAPKIFHETCLIDFNKKANEVVNFVKGLAPYPLAHFEFNDVEMKVYKAETEISNHEFPIGSIHSDRKKYLKIAVKEGFVHLTDVKLENKKRMLINDFLNGYHWD